MRLSSSDISCLLCSCHIGLASLTRRLACHLQVKEDLVRRDTVFTPKMRACLHATAERSDTAPIWLLVTRLPNSAFIESRVRVITRGHLRCYHSVRSCHLRLQYLHADRCRRRNLQAEWVSNGGKVLA